MIASERKQTHIDAQLSAHPLQLLPGLTPPDRAEVGLYTRREVTLECVRVPQHEAAWVIGLMGDAGHPGPQRRLLLRVQELLLDLRGP